MGEPSPHNIVLVMSGRYEKEGGTTKVVVLNLSSAFVLCAVCFKEESRAAVEVEVV